MVERMLPSKSMGPSCGASQVDPKVTYGDIHLANDKT